MKQEDIKKYINKYLNRLVGDKKSIHTIINYKSTLNHFIKYMCEQEKNEYDTQSLRDLIFNFLYSLDNSYSISTINSKRTVMKNLVSYLADERCIKEDFSPDIKLLKKDKGKKKEVLETKEIQKILEVLTKELKEATGYEVYYKARNMLVFSTLLYTGVRRSELVNIKWDDIDMINNEIEILGKNNKTRIIPLKRELKYQLMDFKEILNVLENAGYNVKSRYIFRTDHKDKKTKEKDKPMTSRNVEYIIKAAMKKANVQKNISPHNLRHNFASYYLKHSDNIPALSGILGHGGPDITMKVYAHEISKEQRAKEMDKVDFGL